MRTVKQAALLFASGVAMLAQQQNVIFTAAGPSGMPGLAGPQTFAFVASSCSVDPLRAIAISAPIYTAVINVYRSVSRHGCYNAAGSDPPRSQKMERGK